VVRRLVDWHSAGVLEVHLAKGDIAGLEPLVGKERFLALQARAREVLDQVDGRVVWNVNSTASGGGVAEMLAVVLAYVTGIGVPGAWVVIEGSPEFFALTKRIHNRLHGVPGDDGALGPREHAIFQEISDLNAAQLRERVRSGDFVLLHDPQTAGLIAPMVDQGAKVIWRCHVGRDDGNGETAQAWSFLQPYLERAHAYVFSRRGYVPDFLDASRAMVIPPAIDPYAVKNRAMDPAVVRSVLMTCGLLAGVPEVDPRFLLGDGTPGVVTHQASVLREGPPPGPEVPLVVQVSRWDHLKDMAGVLRGFVEHVHHPEAHLILAGPDVAGVTDDPEGQRVLEECTELWHALPVEQRRRVSLASLPMQDAVENAWIVNALQRHAYLVVQKSLVEGFGLTVAEAMWKSRPVVASAIGGLQDQVVDGETGILLRDPADLVEFGAAVSALLEDPGRADRYGKAGYQRILAEFLPDRHLAQWGEQLQRLMR
jgi:trehalose synthase